MIPIGALLRVAASKVASTASALKTAVKTTVADIGKTIKATAQKAVKPLATHKAIGNVSRETPKPIVSRETIAPNVPREISSVNIPPETFEDRSDNETFRFLINNAGDPLLSPYDSSDVSLFFSLTKYIWDKPEISLDKRLDAISDFFKKPLIDIFEYIIKSEQAIEYLEDYILGEVNYPKYAFSPYAVSGYQLTNVVVGE